ncbi:hypothetical protein BG005_006525 [Podila minutissima]|nr:hypothetical protein BG005_006525 [Podila minutissima]
MLKCIRARCRENWAKTVAPFSTVWLKELGSLQDDDVLHAFLDLPTLGHSTRYRESQALTDDQQYGEVKRDLKSRHLQMIAIGGIIGTGIFLSSGGSVASAGPLGALVSYTIFGTMIFFIVTSLGEMSAYLPLPGAFTTSGARFVDPALGFGVGVFYAFQWIITVTIEVTAAGKILQYWWPHLPMWIPALIFIVNLVGITLLGVKAFGELEYWLSMIKVLTCFIFIIIGILVDTGAVGGDFIGGRNWHIEGAPIVGETAKEKTVNIFTTCVWAFFSFGGIELIGITAGESSNPAKAVPKAIRQTFWRILPFYILSITVIGLITLGRTPLCSAPSLWKSTRPPRLLPSPRSSRWPILPGADQAINAVLLTAVLSAGQSFFYASTRTLMAMGREGKMPVIFGRVNGRGAPSLLTWMSISVIHLRFRAAFKAQGRSLYELPYVAPLFPYSCYISIALALMIVFMQGYQSVTVVPFEAEGVVAVFVGAPVFFLTIIVWKVVHKTKLVPLLEVDLDSGRDIIVPSSKPSETPKTSIWKKVVHIVA